MARKSTLPKNNAKPSIKKEKPFLFESFTVDGEVFERPVEIENRGQGIDAATREAGNAVREYREQQKNAPAQSVEQAPQGPSN